MEAYEEAARLDKKNLSAKRNLESVKRHIYIFTAYAVNMYWARNYYLS